MSRMCELFLTKLQFTFRVFTISELLLLGVTTFGNCQQPTNVIATIGGRYFLNGFTVFYNVDIEIYR